jgi:phytoene synthase
LPGDWLDEEGLSPMSLSLPENRPALARLAERLARLAQPYQDSARIGASHLPARSRWAVLTAANVYGDIARKVVARGERAWDSRTVVGKPAKLGHVARALAQSLR